MLCVKAFNKHHGNTNIHRIVTVYILFGNNSTRYLKISRTKEREFQKRYIRSPCWTIWRNEKGESFLETFCRKIGCRFFLGTTAKGF